MQNTLAKVLERSAVTSTVAETLDDDDDGAIVQKLQTIRELVQEVEKGHVYFFRLHHPERERLEREGWPSPEKPE